MDAVIDSPSAGRRRGGVEEVMEEVMRRGRWEGEEEEEGKEQRALHHQRGSRH